MKQFTFGILCYRQAGMVTETLESIRYQVETYGSGRKVALIVTDDNSPDGTQEVVRGWVDERGDVFSDVTLLFNEENRGVVYNYHAIINRIGDEPFKILAGDDLIASYDIFSRAEGLAPHELDAYVPLALRGGAVTPLGGYISQRFFEMGHRKSKVYDLRMMRRGGHLSTPTTLCRIEAYRDSEADELNSWFTLFEDDPTWYAILRNLPDSELRFKPGSIVLYRLHDGSISNSSTPNPAFQAELAQLRGVYLQDAGWFEQTYLRSKGSTLPRYLRLDKYVDRLHRLRLRLYCLAHWWEYWRFKAQVEDSAREQQDFYDYIHEIAHSGSTDTPSGAAGARDGRR